jgi:hypothetical protein
LAFAHGARATSACTGPRLTRPFSAWGDHHSYVLVPGQSRGNFNGNGWRLGGGARLKTTTVIAGARAAVLDLPSGAWAVSPEICVAANYSSARTMIRDLAGPSSVMFSVSYMDLSRRSPDLVSAGRVTGTRAWAPSSPMQLRPPSGPGRRLARFRFVAGGTGGDYQLYNFYVDPYSRG